MTEQLSVHVCVHSRVRTHAQCRDYVWVLLKGAGLLAASPTQIVPGSPPGAVGASGESLFLTPLLLCQFEFYCITMCEHALFWRESLSAGLADLKSFGGPI